MCHHRIMNLIKSFKISGVVISFFALFVFVNAQSARDIQSIDALSLDTQDSSWKVTVNLFIGDHYFFIEDIQDTSELIKEIRIKLIQEFETEYSLSEIETKLRIINKEQGADSDLDGTIEEDYQDVTPDEQNIFQLLVAIIMAIIESGNLDISIEELLL